jgi:anti-sigma factor RsiW
MTHEQALDGLASERYLLDEMTEDERFEFEAHYFDCTECAEDVRLGDRIRQESRHAGAAMQGGTEAARPATVLTSPRWWRRPMVAAPWAVAASLAVVASYQSLVTGPTLRESVSPQALETVMLRGATRGAATTLTIAPGQRFVALSADIVAAPQSSTLSYDILDANRQAIASGQAQVPSSGAPLLLLVPVAELQRAGRYALIIRGADQNTVLGEYEFEVSY